MNEIEKKFYCPYCGEKISMLLDLSVDSIDEQTYIEDCEVCCRPIMVSYSISESHELLTFHAQQS